MKEGRLGVDGLGFEGYDEKRITADILKMLI
jgi:hypothetical protein